MEYSENNTFTGNNPSQANDYGVRFNYCYKNTISGNIFEFNNGHGLMLSQSTHNIIENNNGNHNAKYQFYMYYNSNNNIIRNNTLITTGMTSVQYGLVLYKSKDCDVFNNTIDNIYWGVRIWRAENNTIYNNTITKCSVGCDLVTNSENNIITNNDFLNCTWYGVRIISAINNILSNNTVNYCGRNYNESGIGIYYISGNNNTISNNFINFNEWHGIWLKSVNNNTISNNFINFNGNVNFADSGIGIYISGGNNNNISKNIINFNKRYGIWLESANNNTILENDIQSNNPNLLDEGINNICLISSFITNTSTSIVNESVQFNDSSLFNLGQTISYQWNFTDGSPNSTLQNPTHQFTDVGTYNVTLMISDLIGHVSLYTLQITVVPDLQPICDFTANTTSVIENCYVSFTNNCSGGNEPLTYQWNFGDGSSNVTDVNPVHQFTTAGEYQVTLTTQDVNGDTNVSTMIITVIPDLQPICDFTVNATSIIENDYVSFTNNCSGGNEPLTYQWNFGDGSPNSTLQDPTHQYLIAGVYNVTLTVQDFDGDLVSYSIVISVAEQSQSLPPNTIYIIIGVGVLVGVGLLITILIKKKK